MADSSAADEEAGEEGRAAVPEQLVRLLKISQELRNAEDVFEIANGLYRASFVRQLDIATRSTIARRAELYCIIPGQHVHLSDEGNNSLYIILSGSVKIEAAGLEFPPGDTFGFRSKTCPTFQVMADHKVVTCVTRGVAAMVSFDDCLKLWPDAVQRDGGMGCGRPQQQQLARVAEPSHSLVWSPELAKSILLRGGAAGEEALVALEFLNFPPINGYSTELREMLVSRFLMVRANTGGVLLEWTNALPIDPEDVLLSRVRCDSVAIVVSGGLKATCRRAKKPAGSRSIDLSGQSCTKPAAADHSSDENVSVVEGNNLASGSGGGGSCGGGDGGGSGDDADEFVLVHLKQGGVFPPQSGQARQCKDQTDLDQEGNEEGGDFKFCALVADSVSSSPTEILLVDAHIFHDVIYPGANLRYSMESVRETLAKPPNFRSLKEVGYIARNVLLHHVACQQMSATSVERIASRLTGIAAASAGEVLVEHGQKVTHFVLLLRGSASIVHVSKASKSRSQMRRVKVGRLEPGDLWGMQHMNAGADAECEIVAVEGCEVIRGSVDLVRAAERRDCTNRAVGGRAMLSLAVPPAERTRRDVRNIVAEMNTPKSGLDIPRFRHIPACLKYRIASALCLQVWPPFTELTREEADDTGTHLFIVRGSISLQAVGKSQRFMMETLDMSAAGRLMKLDIDNGLALDDWRVSGLGPCVAMLFERQVLGEHPHPEKAKLSVRAVTREETSAALLDSDLYDKNLARFDPKDAHAAVCREVLEQLKLCSESSTGVSGLESDILCRLLGQNRVLKKISVSCRPRLRSAITLKRYHPGEVVTEAEDFGDNFFIILEGRLEYFVQDVHRGVIDHTLAKEVGLVPRLHCVGVMTTGDFFGPEAMTNQRASGRGRGPRVVPSGSYRIRCCSDVSAPSGGGATCLILPRVKLEEAVGKDDQLNKSLLDKKLTSGKASAHMETPGSSPRVSFGGPEPRFRGVAAVAVSGVQQDVGEKEGFDVKHSYLSTQPHADIPSIMATAFDPGVRSGAVAARGKGVCRECLFEVPSGEKKSVGNKTTAVTAATATAAATAATDLNQEERQHHHHRQHQDSDVFATDTPAEGRGKRDVDDETTATTTANTTATSTAAFFLNQERQHHFQQQQQHQDSDAYSAGAPPAEGEATAAAEGAAAAAGSPEVAAAAAAVSVSVSAAGTAVVAPTPPPLPRSPQTLSQAGRDRGVEDSYICQPATTAQSPKGKPAVAADTAVVVAVPDLPNTMMESSRQEAFITSVPSSLIPRFGTVTTPPAETAVTTDVGQSPQTQPAEKTLTTNVSQSPPSEPSETAVKNDVGQSPLSEPPETAVIYDAGQSPSPTPNETAVIKDVSQSPSAESPSAGCVDETQKDNSVVRVTIDNSTMLLAGKRLFCEKCGQPIDSAGRVISTQGVVTSSSVTRDDPPLNCGVKWADGAGSEDRRTADVGTADREGGEGFAMIVWGRDATAEVGGRAGPGSVVWGGKATAGVGEGRGPVSNVWGGEATTGAGEERGPISTVDGGNASTEQQRRAVGGAEDRRRRDLMDSLMSFISFHVNPFKEQQRRSQGPPREDFSARFRTDEMNLLSMLSGVSRGPSLEESQAVALDLHPIPLCCRQVLPLPTFCGDVGNIIGGTSHPPASHHRGRVYKYSNAAGVNFNSVSQQHSARNASPPLPAPPTRKATPKTTATTAADGIGSTHQQQGCHRGNVPSTRTPVPKTATSTTITTDGADSTQQQQDRHSGDAPSSRKTVSTTTTAYGIDTTRLQQQGSDRTSNSASSSRADPARTRTTTRNATAVELRLQHHSNNDTININGHDVTIIRKKWRSNSNTTDNHGEFYSERGIDNRGKKSEDNRELIRHHPPPGYGKQSASNGHGLSPHLDFNCSRPETDRCKEGEEEGDPRVVRVPHQPPMRTRPLTGNNPRARSLLQKQAKQEIRTPPRRLRSAPTPATRFERDDGSRRTRDCRSSSLNGNGDGDSDFSHGREENSGGQRETKATARGIWDEEFCQSRQERFFRQRETGATARVIGDAFFSQRWQGNSCGRREVNKVTKARGIEGASHSDTYSNLCLYSSTTTSGGRGGGGGGGAAQHVDNNDTYCADYGGGHNRSGNYAHGGGRSGRSNRWGSCTGAPSRGSQASPHPGGGGPFGGDHPPCNLTSRVEVTALPRLHRRHAAASASVGGTVRGTVRGTDRGYVHEGDGGEGTRRTAGVLKYGSRRNCVFTKRATVGGRRGSPPKQPSAVRRMKATLEDMNDLNSVANW